MIEIIVQTSNLVNVFRNQQWDSRLNLSNIFSILYRWQKWNRTHLNFKFEENLIPHQMYWTLLIIKQSFVGSEENVQFDAIIGSKN